MHHASGLLTTRTIELKAGIAITLARYTTVDWNRLKVLLSFQLTKNVTTVGTIQLLTTF
jgi:hypothetical protein